MATPIKAGMWVRVTVAGRYPTESTGGHAFKYGTVPYQKVIDVRIGECGAVKLVGGDTAEVVFNNFTACVPVKNLEEV